MQTAHFKTTTSGIAKAVGSEEGRVIGMYITDGKTFYNISFPAYGGDVMGIADSALVVTEVPDEASDPT